MIKILRIISINDAFPMLTNVDGSPPQNNSYNDY